MTNALEHAWQGDYAERWLRVEAQKNRQLGPLGRAALTALKARTGEWILDVGCGAGATLKDLAQATAPEGGVVGLDVSAPMLQRARESCAEAGLSNVRFELADAATCVFDRSYDALFSRFGVMFFDDPVAAFTNLRRALKSGGRIAFVCWQSLAQNPWAELPLLALRAAVPETLVPEMFRPGQVGPFCFGERSFVHDVLRDAGFAEIRVDPHRQHVSLGETLDDAVHFCLETGPSGRFAGDAGEERGEACRVALERVLGAHTNERGTWMEASVWVVRARSWAPTP